MAPKKINFKIPKARETAKKSVTRSWLRSYTFRMEFFENIHVGLPLILTIIEAFCLVFVVRCFSALWNNCYVISSIGSNTDHLKHFGEKSLVLLMLVWNRYLLSYLIYFIVKLLTCIEHGSIEFVKFSASFGRSDCCRKYDALNNDSVRS